MGTADGQVTPPEGFVIEASGPTPPPGFEIEGPVSAAVVRRSAGALGRKAVGAAAKVIQQRDEGIDYSGVPDSSVQAKYSLLSKPEDKTAYLKSVYGADNVTKDSYGADIIIQDGKKKAFQSKVYGSEQPSSVASQYAGLAGEVLPVAGMVAGGIAGAPLGPAGGAAMSAGGGGAGVAANKLLARAMGLPVTEDSSETAESIVKEGMLPGALGEAGARTLGFIGRTVLGPWQPKSAFGPWERNLERWKEQMSEAQSARDAGLRMHLGAAQPQATITARAQSMSQRLFGDEIPQINRPVIEKKAGALTEDAAGGTVEPALRDEKALSARVSGRATEAAAAAEQTAAAARTAAEDAIRRGQEALSRSVGAPKGDLAASVSADIRGARIDFGAKAKDLYKPIDELAGQPMVPTAGLKAELAKVLNENPLTKPGEVFAKSISDLPEKVSFQQMQAIRSTLQSRGDYAALNPGLGDRQMARLGTAANLAFDQASGTVGQEAALALRRADQFYKAGIKRFDDMTSTALVKDATKAGYVEPEKVARYIATPGDADKLLRIKRVVKPETFDEIGRQTWSNILRDSADPLTGQVDGKRLSGMLRNYSKNKTLDILFGENAPQMRSLAAQLSALDGKLPAEALQSGDIKTAIQTALKTQKEADTLMSQSWLKNVRAEGPRSIEAADWLTRSDNQLHLRNALKTLGPQSGEAAALKEYLARRLFGTMEQSTGGGAGRGAEKFSQTELMGEPLLKELNAYGKDYLNEVFGKEWTDKTFAFAKAVEVASRKNPTDSGGIIASMIGIHPLHYAGTLAALFAKGEVFASTQFIDYAMNGLLKGGTGQLVRDISMFSTRAAGDIGAEHGMKRSSDYAQGVKNKMQNQAGELAR